MMNTMDIIRNAEKTDALEIQNSVNTVLSQKAFQKLETIKRDIASNLLQNSKPGDEET
jgi:hypothetical protein